MREILECMKAHLLIVLNTWYVTSILRTILLFPLNLLHRLPHTITLGVGDALERCVRIALRLLLALLGMMLWEHRSSKVRR